MEGQIAFIFRETKRLDLKSELIEKSKKEIYYKNRTNMEKGNDS